MVNEDEASVDLSTALIPEPLTPKPLVAGVDAVDTLVELPYFSSMDSKCLM